MLRQQLSGAAAVAGPFVPPTAPVVTNCNCGSDIEQLESLYKKADERCGILKAEKESLENDLIELGNKLEESEHIVRVQTKQCTDACENEWNALVKFEALQENVAQLEGELRQANERLAGLARREVLEPTTLFRATDAETYVSDLFDSIEAEDVVQDAGAAPTQSRKRKGDSPTDNDAEFGSRAQKSKKKKAKVDEEYEEEMSGLDLPHQLDMYIDGVGANFDGVSMDNFEQQPMGDEQQGGPEVIAEVDKMVEDFMAQQRVDRPDAVSVADQDQTDQTDDLAEEAQEKKIVDVDHETATVQTQIQMEVIDEQNARAAGSDPIPLPQDRDMGSLVQMGLDTPKEMDTSDTPRNFVQEMFGAGGITQRAKMIASVAAKIGQLPNAVDIAKRRQLSITPPRSAEDTDTVNNNTYPQTALHTVPADVQRDGDVKDQATEADGEGKGSSQGSSSSNGTSSGATYYSCRSSQSDVVHPGPGGNVS